MATRHPAAAAAEAFDRDNPPDTGGAGASADAPATKTDPAASTAAPVTKTDPAPAAPAGGAPAVAHTDPDIEALRARLAQAETERDTHRQAALDASRLIGQYETNGATAAEQLRSARERIAEIERQNEETVAQLRQAQRERSYAIDYSGLESVTVEAARELDEKILKPRLMRIEDEYQRSLRDAQTTFDNRLKEITAGQTRLTDGQKNAGLAATNREIFRRHADFEALRDDPQFNAFLDTRIPGSRRTYRDEMKAAYYDGDPDYVCEVIDTYKGRGGNGAGGAARPDLAKVADAGATRVATEPAAPVEKQHSMKEFEDMAFRFRSRQISADAWRKYRAEFDRAEAEGRVH